jgi:DNA-binding LytR/AlgR family response regulator
MNHLLAQRTDLVLLDIEMPEINGLEMLDSLPYQPLVIFVTGHKDYALQAFDYRVVDFLVKPVQPGRFMKAVNKAMGNGPFAPGGAQEAEQPPSEEEASQYLFIRVDEGLKKLDQDEIRWVEAYGDFVKIFTTERRFTVYATMKDIEAKLSPKQFMRVHRSYLVNITHVNGMEDNLLVLEDKLIPVSKRRHAEVLRRLNPL